MRYISDVRAQKEEVTHDLLADVPDSLQGGLSQVGVVVSLDKVEEVGDKRLPPTERDLDGGDGGDDLTGCVPRSSIGRSEGGHGVVFDLVTRLFVQIPPSRFQLIPPALFPGL